MYIFGGIIGSTSVSVILILIMVQYIPRDSISMEKKSEFGLGIIGMAERITSYNTAMMAFIMVFIKHGLRMVN